MRNPAPGPVPFELRQVERLRASDLVSQPVVARGRNASESRVETSATRPGEQIKRCGPHLRSAWWR
jgi:hypothetical protein